MKKVLILVLFVIMITGCSYYNINKTSEDDLVSAVMTSTNSKADMPFKGYKLYLPEGISVIDDTNSNNVLYSNGDKYYLYVDLISYYNKKDNTYVINDEKEAFYSKTLNYNDRKGYVLITKIDNSYFVEIMYNYAKIELITKDYKSAMVKSLIILKNISYNDKVIESLIGKNVLTYDTEDYNLLGPSNETIDFLQVYEDIENEFKDKEEKEIEIAD